MWNCGIVRIDLVSDCAVSCKSSKFEKVVWNGYIECFNNHGNNELDLLSEWISGFLPSGVEVMDSSVGTASVDPVPSEGPVTSSVNSFVELSVNAVEEVSVESVLELPATTVVVEIRGPPSV